MSQAIWRSLAETRQKAERRRLYIQVSLFITPDTKQIKASSRVGAQYVGLHTGAYAEQFDQKRERNLELERLITAANLAHSLDLKVNAGHGLNYQNVPLIHTVPHLVELNIGHSIVSRAVMDGLTVAVREMLKLLEGYRN